ncbi:MAG: glycosyltransferase family 4 protein [Acidobacteria bacterium]|nr:glycosyltransferase family 4 protein [Acidobacteriota bacterium]
MKIAYITAGAGGTICGNCLRDNTLARAFIELGHDVQLIPTYTPIRTDERDVSGDRVFIGGLRIYLQQVLPVTRRLPRSIGALLDRPNLLRWISKFAVNTQPEKLGALTVGVLEGESGPFRTELEPLVNWLSDWQPDVIHITNSMLSSLAPMFKRRIRAPVFCSLQGEDFFLSSLPSPYSDRAFALLPELARSVDVFISPSRDHAETMGPHLGLQPEGIPVVHPGIDLAGYEARHRRNPDEFVVGYLARVAPEKGLKSLAEAFGHLCAGHDGGPRVRLRVAGWLSAEHRPFLAEVERQLLSSGIIEDYEYLGELDHEQKIAFLRSLDVLSVPTSYRAPKGLYVLEALACGVPVVQPRIGVFPELIDATGGGLLCEPGNPHDLANRLAQLMTHPAEADQMGTKGRHRVRAHFNSKRMAEQTLAVYENVPKYRVRRR